MHKLFKIYYFIDKFNSEEIKKLDKKISLIFRDYTQKYNIDTINNIKKLCDKHKRKLYISNDLKLAKKLRLNGVYIPSFNKLDNFRNLNVKNGFEILGSAHNQVEMKNKEKQGCNQIFISPIFKTNKSKFFLNTVRFNLIAKGSNRSIIALGGINSKNFNKLKAIFCDGFASISWIKKTGLKN
jgi:thiamine-phosphate pyrophosphorylase